ncbi:IS1595 family transposase [Spirulina sp. 06S082]|uniref:IS1595 family transposase n=1 Tax=Spirulina sp. 06S082 TaxID=3110248 RepID=UPI002B21059B|nr:IS1595 family transposase [Spirulina sp. 06S082]MEA5470432.1 IS1595 family transposase [Spirulina sp. 06S082]
MLKTSKEYLAYLEQIRWGGIPQCPYCESIKASLLKKEQRYHCNECFTSYSVTVGTLFHQTHVDLKKWFLAIALVVGRPEGISVRKLAKAIEVNKNTAALMIKRIHQAAIDEPELLEKILGAEIDESSRT